MSAATDRANVILKFNRARNAILEHTKLFPDAFAMANKKSGTHFSHLVTSNEIGRWMQEYWEALPDSGNIRVGAFMTICDIAEWWCFGSEDGYGNNRKRA